MWLRGMVLMSMESIVIDPEWISTIRKRARTREVFPLPDRPHMPTFSPCFSVRLMFCNASLSSSGLYETDRFLISIRPCSGQEADGMKFSVGDSSFAVVSLKPLILLTEPMEISNCVQSETIPLKKPLNDMMLTTATPAYPAFDRR